MKTAPRLVLLVLLLVASSWNAAADQKTRLSTENGKTSSSWSRSGDGDVHEVKSKSFAGQGRKLNAEETARLKIEWTGAAPGSLAHLDPTVPPSTLWAEAKNGEGYHHVGVRGRLLLVSADGKRSAQVSWPLPVRVLLERRPGSDPDWTKGHANTTTATADTLVEKDGTFLAAFDAADLRRVPGKEAQFRAGVCLGTHKGNTMTWTSAAPVLAQSITRLGIKGPPPLSHIQQLINGAPSPAGDSFDPAALLRAVNGLHALGKDQAIAELREFLKVAGWGGFHERVPEDITTSDEQCVFGIVMLLFEADSAKFPMPSPALGSPSPSPDPKDWQQWPLYPFVLVDDVPFCLTQGYTLGGMPSHPAQHLAWAEAHGRLRAKPLRPTSNPVAAAAKFLATPHGQRLFGTNCGEYEYGILLRQAVTALPSLLPASQAYYRFNCDKKYDGDADWLDCKNKAAALDLKWDPTAMKWLGGNR